MGFPLFRMLRPFYLFLVTSLLAPAAVTAQTRAAGAGVIDGVVSTQGGAIRLGGVQLAVRDATDREVATVLSDGDGHFRLVALPDGKYRVVAAIAGFETTTVPAVVTAGKTTDVSLDLPIAAISQTVEVVGTAVALPAVTIAGTVVVSKPASPATTRYLPSGNATRRKWPSPSLSTAATSRSVASRTTIWAPPRRMVPPCVETTPSITPPLAARVCPDTTAGANRLVTRRR